MLKHLLGIIEEKGDLALQYGPSEGFNFVREELARFVKRRRKIKTGFENIYITTGSQQMLYLVPQLFIDEGDIIGVERPTYVGALCAFNFCGPKYMEIKLVEDGLDTYELENKLKTTKIKFFYTIPIFHNPHGSTATLEKKKHLLELAEKHDFYILEDDPYGELAYDKLEYLPIKALDRNDRVIYISTFSKTFCPGFRLAFSIVPKDLLEKMLLLKQNADLCPASFGQFLLFEYLKTKEIDKQIDFIKKYYKKLRDAMAESLEKYFPKSAKWHIPKGGMFFWISGLKMDTELLLKKSIQKKVLFVPGHSFFATNPEKDCMRLNFTYESEEKIDKGIKILGNLVKNL
ncbi:MAG: PLP-dependent aminotransferase family protein [Nitrososphaeria archaeon]